MLRKLSVPSMLIIFAFVVISYSGCDKKETDNKEVSNSKGSGETSELLKKDEKGTKVNLIVKPKKGDVFRYKINAKTSSSEKSPLTGDKEMSSDQDINYFYTEEVNDISSAGIVTYKIRFDSINIVSRYQVSRFVCQHDLQFKHKGFIIQQAGISSIQCHNE
jgi:hypothetical protein